MSFLEINTEADILTLIQAQAMESLTLEYKRSDSMKLDEKSRNEFAKDVSAFANSNGGQIIYGVIENGHIPVAIDDGLDRNIISKEWIEQVSNSRVSPKIDGLRIVQIPLPSRGTERVAYAITIPQAKARAPHQASDKRYYRRFNFQSVPMEDYEIRDLLHRESDPELFITFNLPGGQNREVQPAPNSEYSAPIPLVVSIGNRSSQPAYYTVARIYMDARLRLSGHEFENLGTDLYAMRGTPAVPIKLTTLVKKLSIPGSFPLFKEQIFKLSDLQFSIPMADVEATMATTYVIGYSLLTPGNTSNGWGDLLLHNRHVTLAFPDTD